VNHLNGPLPDRARASLDRDDLDENFGAGYDIAASRDGTLWASRYRDAGDADPVLIALSAAALRRLLEDDYAARSQRRVTPGGAPPPEQP
jgi:hypothetical protein